MYTVTCCSPHSRGCSQFNARSTTFGHFSPHSRGFLVSSPLALMFYSMDTSQRINPPQLSGGFIYISCIQTLVLLNVAAELPTWQRANHQHGAGLLRLQHAVISDVDRHVHRRATRGIWEENVAGSSVLRGHRHT